MKFETKLSEGLRFAITFDFALFSVNKMVIFTRIKALILKVLSK